MSLSSSTPGMPVRYSRKSCRATALHYTHRHREREREGGREGERERDRQTDTHTHTHTERERERERERETLPMGRVLPSRLLLSSPRSAAVSLS